jgi:hypothetical protein
VVTPPLKKTSLMLARTDIDRPLYTSLCCPNREAGRTRLFTSPNFVGMTSYNPQIWLPLTGKRPSLGALTQYSL